MKPISFFSTVKQVPSKHPVWMIIICFGLGLMMVVCFGLGFVTHWTLFDSRGTGETAEADEENQPLFWSCAMHPEVQMPGPGKCPKCPMALKAIYESGNGQVISLRQVSFSPEAVALMNIQTSPVEKRFVTAEVRMVGKVEYDETRLKYITARIPGRLERLFVDSTGIPVKKGDHLVQLYSEELYTAQDVLIKALQERRTTKRRDPLFADELDVVESTREKLRLWGMTPKQIKEIEQLKTPSEHMTIYSEIDGIVIQKHLLEGDRVKTGDRIYTIADLSHLWVKLDAYESDHAWLRYGQQVKFTTDAYPGETFVGKISQIDPFLNPKTRTVKVRVNVPNLRGKLKPEMFVRGVVKVELAARGRVMNLGLAGKWISPMHPEIIRDKPGKCPICGMALVTAEERGYVSPETGDAEKPLLIPASAALVTGKRAIVYVEVPGQQQPTFEGREIVLGPRAGDYYLVKSGLKEGELVVTHGNFKIDSALQIQSKPSMMTPQGGGGGSAHHHGHDHSAVKTGPSRNEGERQSLPVSFQAFLSRLEMSHADVQDAVNGKNSRQIQTALSAMRSTLQKGRTEAENLTGDAKLQWKELSMLLENDLVEGHDAQGSNERKQPLQKLAVTMNRIRGQFGSSSGSHDQHRSPHYEVPQRFQAQLNQFWNSYRQLQKALAADNLKTSQQVVNQLQRAAAGIEMKSLSPNAHTAWMRVRPKLKTVLQNLKKSQNLQTLRIHFEPLSDEMLMLVRTFGIGPGEPVYQLHCPMAFKNKGASWLQDHDQVRNPYFGASMLKCADTLNLISDGQKHDHDGAHPSGKRNGKTAPHKEGHRHE